MALTEDEKLIATTLKGKGYSSSQIIGYIGGQRTGRPSSVSLTDRSVSETPPSPFSETLGDIRETTQALSDTVDAGIETQNNIQSLEQSGEVSEGLAFLQRIGSGAGTVARGIGDIFTGGLKVLSKQGTEDKANELLQSAAQTVSQNEGVRSAIGWYTGLPPAQRQSLDSAIGFGSLLAEFVGFGAGARATSQARRVLGGSFERLPNIDITTPEFQSFRGGLDTFAQNQIRKDIDELLGSTKALAKRSQEAEQFNVNFNEILSDPVVYNGLKVENGKIVPDQAMEVLQTRIDALMDAKRAMLPEVDRLTRSIPREVIRQRAYNDIQGSPSPADELIIRARIDKQIDALPEEIPISQVDALRAQFRNSGRDAKGNLKPANHYAALENATREIVFDATDNLNSSNAADFKALNDYVKSMIRTKDFLNDNLRGQVVKGGRLRNYAMRGVGAIAGSQGGVLGALAGSEIGGVVADVITNNALGSSLKMRLIRDLTDDPEIIRRAQKLLGDIESQTLPLLKQADPNTPRTQVGSGRPIEMPPRLQSDVDAAERANPNIRQPEGRQDLPNDSRGSQLGLSVQDRGAFGRGAEEVFNGYTDLTTKVLNDLKGKSTVSRQFISDLTNKPALKQPERDLIRSVLEEFDGQVPVQEFADKVKARLLPVKTYEISAESRYENITLPSEVRGDVENYVERIFTSPIKNSAGGVHFDGDVFPDYFAHTRIEDMADDSTRRVIEVQSDLFQKGRLEGEYKNPSDLSGYPYANIPTEATLADDLAKMRATGRYTEDELARYATQEREAISKFTNRESELAQLQPYRNTWWERIVREEVRNAAQDGKTKLQFPTGETAMKIEGLGSVDRWTTEVPGSSVFRELTTDNMAIGNKIAQVRGDGLVDDWIITDVLGDGKFMAVPKAQYEDITRAAKSLEGTDKARDLELDLFRASEQFDISGKVDTSNPIYKFYEKDVQKYLKRNYNARNVTDENGVQWVEFDVPNDADQLPIEAFGIAPLLLSDDE